MKRRCPFCGRSMGKKNVAQRDGHLPTIKRPCSRCIADAKHDPSARRYLADVYGIVVRGQRQAPTNH